MTLAQTILDRLKEHLSLPWPENVSPRERVVMVVYPPSDERKLRRLIQSGEFASEMKTTGHGWKEFDLATGFSAWLAEYEYRDRYLSPGAVGKVPQIAPAKRERPERLVLVRERDEMIALLGRVHPEMWTEEIAAGVAV